MDALCSIKVVEIQVSYLLPCLIPLMDKYSVMLKLLKPTLLSALAILWKVDLTSYWL